jgi:hypothetical protein
MFTPASSVHTVFCALCYSAHLVSDAESPLPTPVKINQDFNLFASEVSAGAQVEYEVREGRQAYLMCVEGQGKISYAPLCSTRAATATGADAAALRASSSVLQQGEAAEVYGPLRFTVVPANASNTTAEEAAAAAAGDIDAAMAAADAASAPAPPSCTNVHVIVLEMAHTGEGRTDL